MVFQQLQDLKLKMAKKKEKPEKESGQEEVVEDQDNPKELDSERFTK